MSDRGPSTVGPAGDAITAVIVSYNSAHCIAACVRAIATVLPEAEIVVVDNGSTDESLAVARATDPRVVAVARTDNGGFGRACNEGAQVATRPYLLFTNPDVLLVRLAAETLSRNPEQPFGVAVPRLAERDGGAAEHVVLADPTWMRSTLAEAWQTFRPGFLRRRRRLRRPGGAVWAPGALLLVRADEFSLVGGFDGRFFLYAEDADLCRRYRESGLPLRAVEAFEGKHTKGASTRADPSVSAAIAAWSLLGLFEYYAIWEGRRAALSAVRLWWLSTDLQLRLAGWAGRVPPLRDLAQRKRAEIGSARDALVACACADEDSAHWPEARALVARVADRSGDR